MSKKNIVIIGGGFGGITLARRLERLSPAGADIHLVSEENHITYSPLLAEVAGASILPGHVVAPLRQMVKRTHFLMARVREIDLERQEVRCGDGDPVPFDHLVLALGRRANQAMIPGMERYALPLKTPGDALHIRNRILSRLEQAEFENDPARRCWLTTFIVIGGGASGVEVAGEIMDFLSRSHRYYPRTGQDECRVILLHEGDHILPELSRSLGEYAHRKMSERGMQIHLECRATEIRDEGVVLPDGECIEGGNVISTVGTRPNPLVEALPLEKERGRIVTDPDLSVPGHSNIWALGDCATVPNGKDGPCPPTAQFATRQAKTLGYNIAASLAGRRHREFAYDPVGQLATIGHHNAVAEIYGMRLSGFVAWLLWRAVYLSKMPTFSRKVRVFGEWNWNLFFPPDIARLSLTRTGEED